ncbi:MAG: efflux RND transporter permease subunit [Bdellovibrionota bacterium]
MTLSEISIRRPVMAWMLMAAIILFGWLSFQRLGLSQLPDVDAPVVGVNVNLPGAAPEVVESQVLDPIEDAIMELDGVVNVQSTAQLGSGHISVEFELSRNIDESMQQIQAKIAQRSNVLPTGLRPPTTRKSNPEDQPILWVALTSNEENPNLPEMMIFARNYLQNQFASISGVGDVGLGGYVDPALRVWVDLDKLDQLDMTADDVMQTIKSSHMEQPEGTINGGKTEMNVRVLGEASNPEDFSKIIVQSRSGGGVNYQPIRIGQVAKVEEGIQDVRKIARFNGKRVVALGILKQHGSNAVEVANLVRAKLEEIRPNIPKKYNVDIRSDNTRFVKQAVDELLFMLCLSALLTSAVCYLFLGSWTSTLNVLMSIPTSIIGAFTAFLFFGFTLNTFTMLGLSLAIGIVVDDSIMMLENIVRHRELGLDKREAALVGAKEITFAALAATLAIVAIFLPVIFMQGVIGRYLLQYGITVTVAVLLSLLEALTLTPMRCSRFLEISQNPKGILKYMNFLFARLERVYQRVLAVLIDNRPHRGTFGLIDNRVLTIVATFIFFAGSCYITRFIPQEMLPSQDQSQLMMRIKLPVGTALGITDRRMKEVEDYLQKQPEVTGVFSTVGGFGGDAINQGFIMITLVEPPNRKFSQKQLMDKWREEMKTALVLTEGETPPGLSPFEFAVEGVGMEGKGLAAMAGGRGGRGQRGGPGAEATPPAAAGEGKHGDWKKKEAAAPGEERKAWAGKSHAPQAAVGAVDAGKDSAGGRHGPGGGKGDVAKAGARGGRGGGRGGTFLYHGMQVNMQDMSLRGFSSGRGFPIEFIIQGPDWAKLNSLSNDLMAAIEKSGLAVDVNTDIQPAMPEVALIPNRNSLMKRGVTLSTVTSNINSLVGGALIEKENSYSEAGHRYQIEVRLNGLQRDSVADLDRIKVRNDAGEVVKLSQLVERKIVPSPNTITRLNRARAIRIFGNPAPGISQDVAMKGVEKVARGIMPPGYSVIMTGSSKDFSNTFKSLIVALLMGVLVSYMVLASQFNSFIHPVAVLMALPFSFSGAFIGLLLLHQSINLYSLIGFILLMGIVKKNSILLVDFTNHVRRSEGANVKDALLKACPIRLRPIMMTSIATVAGALPEALSIGPGAETTIPMAVAIIGGVVASTFLTLFAVPCVYSLLSRFESPAQVEEAPTPKRVAAGAGPHPVPTYK